MIISVANVSIFFLSYETLYTSLLTAQTVSFSSHVYLTIFMAVLHEISSSMFCSPDFSDLWLKQNTKLKVMEGAKGNLPDADSERAAHAIKKLVTSLTERHILIVLISGNYH